MAAKRFLFVSLFFFVPLSVGALVELSKDGELDQKDRATETSEHTQKTRIAAAQRDAMRRRCEKEGGQSVVVEREEQNIPEGQREELEEPISKGIATVITNILSESRADCDQATCGSRTRPVLTEYQDLRDYYERTEYFISLAFFLSEQSSRRLISIDSKAVVDLLEITKNVILLRQQFLQACREDIAEKVKEQSFLYHKEEEVFWKSIRELTGLSFDEIEEITKISILPKKASKKVTFSCPRIVPDQEPATRRTSSCSQKYEYILPARRGLPGGW